MSNRNIVAQLTRSVRRPTSWLVALGAVWAVTVASPLYGQPAAAWQLKAMTFNIRFDNPADGPDAWSERREWVAELIDQQAPDVLGMQEVLASQADFLAQSLTDYAWYGVGRDDGKRKGEFSPIFYRKGRFERLSQGTFWLSEQPEQPGSRSWDAAITRICSWVKLKDRDSNRELMVFNTHFDHRGEQARRESATLIRQQITRLAGKTPWVLLGDFNATPDGEVYQRLTQSLDEVADSQDAFVRSERKPEGPNSTWNGFKQVQPGQRIDYVFVDSLATVSQVVVLAEQRDGRFPSDHLPVLATLAWPAPNPQ